MPWESQGVESLCLNVDLYFSTYFQPVTDSKGLSGGSVVKNLPANIREQETQDWSPGWKDPLEKEMATHSSILAWKIPWTEEPGRLQSMGSHRLRHDWMTEYNTVLTLKKEIKCHSIEGVMSTRLINQNLPPELLAFGFFLRQSLS